MAPTTLLYGVQPSCSKWHFIPWNGQQRRYFVCKMWNRKQQHQPVCIITVVFFSIRFHGTKFKLFFLIHQALKFSNYYELHTNIKPIVFRMFFFSILLIEKIIYQYLLIRCSFAIKNTSGKFYSTFNEEKLIRSNFRRHNFLYTVKCWLYGFQSLVSFSYLSIHCHISLSLISFAIVVFVVVVVTFELTPLQCDMKKYASLNQSHTSAFYRNERSKHWMYDCHFSCNLNHMMLLGSFDLSAFVIIEDTFSVTGVFRLITNYWKSRHTINTTDALSLSLSHAHTRSHSGVLKILNQLNSKQNPINQISCVCFAPARIHDLTRPTKKERWWRTNEICVLHCFSFVCFFISHWFFFGFIRIIWNTITYVKILLLYVHTMSGCRIVVIRLLVWNWRNVDFENVSLQNRVVFFLSILA